MKYDAIVLGSGVAGLTSALILAKRGKKVALVEKSTTLAPLLRGFRRKKLYFDTGFHYAGAMRPGEIMHTYLNFLGLLQHVDIVPKNANLVDTYLLAQPEFTCEFHYGYEGILENLGGLFPQEKDALRSYLKALRGEYDSSHHINLDLSFETGLPKSSPFDDMTLQGVLDSYFRDPVLKNILTMHSFFYGVPAWQISFTNHARFVGSYYQSAQRFKGGGLNLIQAFTKVLKKNGVELLCGQGAVEILASSTGACSGVRLENNDILESPCCVSTLHPHQFLEIAPEKAFRPAYSQRVSQMEETFSAYVVYGATKAASSILEKGSLFYVPDLESPVDKLETTSVEQRPAFLSFEDVPEGNTSRERGVSIICPASSRETARWNSSPEKVRPEGYSAFKDEMAMRVLEHAKHICPDLAQDVRVVDSATPLTFRDYNNTPVGSLYGLRHKIGERYPGPVTRVPGLFLAGQAITGPGLLGAMVSGFLACEIILQDLQLRTELRKCR